MELGRLARVDLRSVWQSEPQGFTPWLAAPENLGLLGEAIGIDLELEALERWVGPFRADILCRNASDESWVLVENQIERTDHVHLGQIITYAAGLDAVTIVWIAARFTEEHRAALDWLNRHTAAPLRFFGLEIELWRIGLSPPAPKFNVVAQPNDWAGAVESGARSVSGGGATDERKQIYVAYWTAFADLLAERGSPLRLGQAPAQYSVAFGSGRPGVQLLVQAGFRDKWLSVAVAAPNDSAKDVFRALLADRVAIEQAIGATLDWQERPELKRWQIEWRRGGPDPLDEGDWPNQHAWLADGLERLARVFRTRLQAAPPDATPAAVDPSLDE
ncbi:DUF4268 domain-containing protein [Marinivivus vitaminiproducens]|uniref:DUF4268 domain-containing protein n=1 Tax=Marinivivus vitaminiproducens TaxID=3035935 RepID=UPI0027981A01|nr:DUF4268 domain-containing protein [Geminicoccaceae bacterium SCSIO 64248]